MRKIERFSILFGINMDAAVIKNLLADYKNCYGQNTRMLSLKPTH